MNNSVNIDPFAKAIIPLSIAILIAGGFLYWYANRDFLDVKQPETLVGCNFADESQCVVGQKASVYWESEILSKFDEGRLTIDGDPSIEVYRLVMLPTFDNPISIRIWTDGDRKFIATKRLSGSGGFGSEEFGVLSLAEKRELTDEEWRKAIDRIDNSRFWRLSPRTDELPSPDGAYWYLEGMKAGYYNQVGRKHPEEKLLQCMTCLLELSGFSNEYKGYWN